MTMKVIKLSVGTNSRVFSMDNLEDICLEMAGGGTTEEQTMKAMALARQLERGDPVVTRKYTVEIVEA
jgi:hypothetical protein